MKIKYGQPCHYDVGELLSSTSETERKLRFLHLLINKQQLAFVTLLEAGAMLMAVSAIDFSGYITERTRGFVGRTWVLKEVDRWLADPSAPRYLLITGEPGIGKTAIAARLTQIRCLSAWHFCVANREEALDPYMFALSLFYQLQRIKGFTESLPLPSVHIEVQQTVETVSGQLTGVAIEHFYGNPRAAFAQFVLSPLQRLYTQGYTEEIIILVDALDEAVVSSSPSIIDLVANVQGLPGQVRFVLTTRTDDAVLDRFQPRHVLQVHAGLRENLDDARAYIETQLAASQKMRERLAAQENTRVFISRVLDASAGNFLYLSLLLDSIERGLQPYDSPDVLPRGIDDIYRSLLRARRVGTDSEAWRTRFRPLLGCLMAAQSPLSPTQLAQFTGLDYQNVLDALQDLRQFFDPTVMDRHEVRLYHRSMVDFLSSRTRAGPFWIHIEASHHTIAAYFQQSSHGSWRNLHDRYGRAHLITHLLLGGQATEALDLVRNTDWVILQLAHDRAGRFYARDLARVSVWLDQRAELGLLIESSLALRYLPDLCSIALISASLNTLNTDAPLEAIAALAYIGDVEAALNCATLVRNTGTPSNSWVAIDELGHEEHLLAIGRRAEALRRIALVCRRKVRLATNPEQIAYFERGARTALDHLVVEMRASYGLSMGSKEGTWVDVSDQQHGYSAMLALLETFQMGDAIEILAEVYAREADVSPLRYALASLVRIDQTERAVRFAEHLPECSLSIEGYCAIAWESLLQGDRVTAIHMLDKLRQLAGRQDESNACDDEITSSLQPAIAELEALLTQLPLAAHVALAAAKTETSFWPVRQIFWEWRTAQLHAAKRGLRALDETQLPGEWQQFLKYSTAHGLLPDICWLVEDLSRVTWFTSNGAIYSALWFSLLARFLAHEGDTPAAVQFARAAQQVVPGLLGVEPGIRRTEMLGFLLRQLCATPFLLDVERLLELIQSAQYAHKDIRGRTLAVATESLAPRLNHERAAELLENALEIIKAHERNDFRIAAWARAAVAFARCLGPQYGGQVLAEAITNVQETMAHDRDYDLVLASESLAQAAAQLGDRALITRIMTLSRMIHETNRSRKVRHAYQTGVVSGLADSGALTCAWAALEQIWDDGFEPGRTWEWLEWRRVAARAVVRAAKNCADKAELDRLIEVTQGTDVGKALTSPQLNAPENDTEDVDSEAERPLNARQIRALLRAANDRARTIGDHEDKLRELARAATKLHDLDALDLILEAAEYSSNPHWEDSAMGWDWCRANVVQTVADALIQLGAIDRVHRLAAETESDRQIAALVAASVSALTKRRDWSQTSWVLNLSERVRDPLQREWARRRTAHLLALAGWHEQAWEVGREAIGLAIQRLAGQEPNLFICVSEVCRSLAPLAAEDHLTAIRFVHHIIRSARDLTQGDALAIVAALFAFLGPFGRREIMENAWRVWHNHGKVWQAMISA